MASLSELREERIKKLKILTDKGINPYPKDAKRDFSLKEVLENYSKLSKRKRPFHVVGRIVGVREHGGSIFLDLDDGTSRLQVYVKKNELGNGPYSLFKEVIDIGDFVEFRGTLFTTKKKEKSLSASSWKMLAKALRPLPDKWHGLQDVEERFRKRYLDILMNDEVKNRFLVRAGVISEIRCFLDRDGFIEVETPALQPLAGGATALPFITHHNALDVDLYLRISDELYLKRLLIAGMPKIYEIARDFRNEGIDATHNPEFTMLEYYEAYTDAGEQRKKVEKLIKYLVRKVLKSAKIKYQDSTIDFSKKFTVVTFYSLLTKHALLKDPENNSIEDLRLKAHQFGVPVEEGESREKIMDNIYKKVCRPKIIQPTFVIDYPKHYLPLAKKIENEENLVDAFQLVIGGIEIVKAFSELNDPVDQEERFRKQEEYGSGGDSEAQRYDADFIEALEYGMPPAGGVGIGIDRILMLLTDVKNIKEVVIFPTLKPRDNG